MVGGAVNESFGAVDESLGWPAHRMLEGETPERVVGCADGVGIGTPGFRCPKCRHITRCRYV